MNHDQDERESLISEMSERFLNGVFKENPTFVLLLGMCPTLAVTTSAKNGLGMGITTLVVLALSNLFISLLRKRIPAFIVIIASFVTLVELLLNAYLPGLYKALGLYIPLIVVNCIILGRAEAYAYSHSPLLSLFDGLGMGTGFTFALTIIGALRELLGAGTIFGANVMPKGYVPVSIFIMAPGAFFVLALLTAIQNKVKEIGEKKGKDMSKIQSGCGQDCLNCNLECATPKVKEAALKEAALSETADDDKPSDEAVTVSEDKPEKAEKPEKPAKSKKDKKKKSKAADKKKDEASEDKKLGKKSKEEPEEEPEESDATETPAASNDDLKAEDTPVAEVKTEEERKSDIESSETVDKAPEAVTEEPVKEEPSENSKASEEEDELEFIDFADLKKAVKASGKETKKPVRKKASLEKARAMLEKAEESLKEEHND